MTVAYYLLASVAFALVTFVCFQFEQQVATPGFLYLMIVVLVSLRGSLVLSAAFSFIGVLCLDYFFTEPRFSLQIDDPINVAAVVAFLAASAVITRLVSRLKETMTRQFSIRLEERVGERTRIARELHDTLLQSFHGLLLRFQAASELLPMRPAEAKQTLDRAIDQAAQAITEGRDAIQGLRASVVETNDLAVAIRTFGEGLAADQTRDRSILHLVVEGTPRTLHPIQRDEIYRIACEALRNAFRHADAKQIEVELRYDEQQLRLRVRDDGKGIDPKSLTDGGRAGHYGLYGMRERATLMGGKLTVWSALDSGVEVELSIPAAYAYAAPASTPRSWFARKSSEESVHSKP